MIASLDSQSIIDNFNTAFLSECCQLAMLLYSQLITQYIAMCNLIAALHFRRVFVGNIQLNSQLDCISATGGKYKSIETGTTSMTWALPLFAESLCKFLPLTTNKIPLFMALPAFFMRLDTRCLLIEKKDNSTYKSLLLGIYIQLRTESYHFIHVII